MNLRRSLPLALTAANIFACVCLSAQNAAPVAPTAAELTLQECITRALAKNFDLEIQRYSPQIAKDAIDIARSDYLPVVTAATSTGASHNDPIIGSVPDPITGVFPVTPASNGSTRSTSIGVTQQLYTGTSLSLSSQLGRSHIDPALSALNPAYNADVTLSVRQQLLRGFGRDVNIAGVNRARLGFARANLDYKSQALTVIRATEGAYHDLVFNREQLEVKKFTLALAERFYEDAKNRKQFGVAIDLDVLTAEVGVANARRGVLLAQQSVGDSAQNLLALIGQFELDAPLGTVRFTEVELTFPVFASSYSLAKQNQPDYLSTQLAVEQAKLDLKVAKDNARPSLSVGGAVGMNGRRGNAGAAFSDTFDRDNNSWQVDLSLTYPWGLVGDKARYRQAQATLSQQQSRLRQLEQSIELQVRTAIRAIETDSESVKISAQARLLSDKQYEFQKALFDSGKSTSYLVLQAQNDLENARVAELQAKVNLRNAVSTLRQIEGSSLQRYGVTLP